MLWNINEMYQNNTWQIIIHIDPLKHIYNIRRVLLSICHFSSGKIHIFILHKQFIPKIFSWKYNFRGNLIKKYTIPTWSMFMNQNLHSTPCNFSWYFYWIVLQKIESGLVQILSWFPSVPRTREVTPLDEILQSIISVPSTQNLLHQILTRFGCSWTLR